MRQQPDAPIRAGRCSIDDQVCLDPSRETPHADLAAGLLDEAHDGKTSPERHEDLIQEATVHALLAVAKELSAIREQIVDVESALRGPDEHGVGSSLHYISDWLEKISRK